MQLLLHSVDHSAKKTQNTATQSFETQNSNIQSAKQVTQSHILEVILLHLLPFPSHHSIFGIIKSDINAGPSQQHLSVNANVHRWTTLEINRNTE